MWVVHRCTWLGAQAPQRLLQPRMPIRHDESRRRQATLLEVGQHRPPRDRRFCGRELQGHEPFLAGQCAPQGPRGRAPRPRGAPAGPSGARHRGTTRRSARRPGGASARSRTTPSTARRSARRRSSRDVGLPAAAARPPESVDCSRPPDSCSEWPHPPRVCVGHTGGSTGSETPASYRRRGGPAPAARAAAAPRRGSSGCGRRCRGDSLPAGPCARGAPIPAPP